MLLHTPALPLGFRCSGTTCGIKASGSADLALFVSDINAVSAGVFTTNRVVGAPVTVSTARAGRSDCRAVIINSGNANACTGDQGLEDARAMTAEVASCLGSQADQVLVCSTGIIGVPLPMEIIRKGIPIGISELDTTDSAFQNASVAMKTTDTFEKQASVDVVLSSGTVRISGAAKGAAMIAPNMATMLGVVMTDAVLTEDQASGMLKTSVNQSFNCITVDGHMSTSDTVLLMANGASGFGIQSVADESAFQLAFDELCRKLATDIIRDAEGAQHFVTVEVSGFDSQPTATAVAKAIAESALVKTAIAGNDPNWGRITSAAGYAGIDFDANHLHLTINGVPVFRNGVPVEFDESSLSTAMKEAGDVILKLTLNGGPFSGDAAAKFWTSDLTQEYVRLNSEYTT
ncbi:MAG: bifunctional glutamate N-acetyltransferase/amino-acid acetyltransferase ArgJ [Fuerstiella sp.]